VGFANASDDLYSNDRTRKRNRFAPPGERSVSAVSPHIGDSLPFFGGIHVANEIKCK
jgi:hypothetical protein